MHWFDYVWMIPIFIAIFAWAFASVIDIIANIRDYIAKKGAGYECSILTYLDNYLEEYTKNFIATILFVLFFSSFVCFVINVSKVIGGKI